MGLAECVTNANWKGATLLAMLSGMMHKYSSLMELRSREAGSESFADACVSLSYLGMGPTAALGVGAAFVLFYPMFKKNTRAYHERYYTTKAFSDSSGGKPGLW